MTEPSAVDRLDAAVHRCAQDTGSVVVVHWPPRWRAPRWLQILCFPYTIRRRRRTRPYSYSAKGWVLQKKKWLRDDHGWKAHWEEKKHGPGWNDGGHNEVLSTAELLRRLGSGVAQAIVRAINATYEEVQDLAYLAAEIEYEQAARAEILVAERRR